MDDKISELFKDYNPGLSSDSLFMERLEHNLRAVDIVKQQLKASHRKNRLAIIAAAITGFIVGVVSVIAYPYLSEIVLKIITNAAFTADFLTDYTDTVVFCMIAIITGLLSYFAYDTTLILTKDKNFQQPHFITHK